MKKLFIPMAVSLLGVLFFSGCLALQVGGGDKKETPKPTIGQQLTDLKAAEAAGAITPAEYQIQKDKLLGGK